MALTARRRVRRSPFSRALLLGLLLAAGVARTCRADEFDDALLIYAVNIRQTPMQSWGPGYGIYLGNGLFVTAAHVAGRAWLTKPKVAIAGREFPTSVVREGSFDGTDLTLLAVAPELLPPRLGLRLNPLCKDEPRPGQDAVTVVPEATARTHVLSPLALPAGARRYATVIGDVARTGNSGSGVFDPQRRCLLGIVSRKISQSLPRPGRPPESHDIAKYFVPASAIKDFIPPGSRRDQ
jgi:hypothetical protein